jgi:high-affinity iron transporter
LLGGTVCLLTYLGLVRIPPRALFATTIVLITLLAAAMAAQAVGFDGRNDGTGVRLASRT